MNTPRRDGIPRWAAEVARMVRAEIEQHGPNVDLNHIDVSQVKTLVDVFKDTAFNGNISQWNVANVENMEGLFKNCPFNGDISNWNTSSLRIATQMFHGSAFNGNISRWDTSHLIMAAAMFQHSQFNGDIYNWNTKQLSVLSCMFENSAFRGDISKWDLACALSRGHLDRIFYNTPYAGDLSSWKAKAQNLDNALGPEFQGIAPRCAEPVSKVFYARLFGTSQRLHKYLRTQTFSGVHFDVLRLAPSKPDWCQKSEYVWARQLGKLGQSVGLDDDALRQYAMAEYRNRMKPVLEPLLITLTGIDLLQDGS